jgi:hypothetical protein
MEMPLWAVFGLISATLSAGVMLVQERVKLDGFVMAFWNKFAAMLFAVPMVLYFGLPSSPVFYVLLFGSAFVWAIGDVIFFNAIPKVGAGVVSRILPASVIITFFLWFLIDPAVWQKYLDTPGRSALVVLVLLGSVYFATRLKNCPVTWEAVRLIWFVFVAAVAWPLVAKLVMGQASPAQGPFAYVFFESLAMVLLWSAYYAFKKPVAWRTLISKKSLKGGFLVGAFSSLMVASNVAAIGLVDNPGLIPAVKFTDTVIILFYYRMISHREKADVISGLGIVACAAAIIILKSGG